jgi:hypothetical protein
MRRSSRAPRSVIQLYWPNSLKEDMVKEPVACRAVSFTPPIKVMGGRRDCGWPRRIGGDDQDYKGGIKILMY